MAAAKKKQEEVVVQDAAPVASSELVQAQPAKEPEPERWIKLEKSQYLTFVRCYNAGQYTEFVLEDVQAIRQGGQVVYVWIYGVAEPLSIVTDNADGLFDAWRSKRAARRNA